MRDQQILLLCGSCSQVEPTILSFMKPSLDRFPMLPFPSTSFQYISHGNYFQ